MSDGHRGGFNSAIKVIRGPMAFVLGYLVESQEGSFWLHLRPPRSQPSGGFDVGDALRLLGFNHFAKCSLVTDECYCLNLREPGPIRPLAGEAVENRFDKLAQELPGILQNLI